MRLWRKAFQRSVKSESRSISVDEWIALLSSQQFGGLRQSIRGDIEPPIGTFDAYALQLFSCNPVVWGAEQIRKAVFSQARFQWMSKSTRKLFGDTSLRVLENPWAGARTSGLLKRMILHADLAGNAFILRTGDRLNLMRPDRVSIVLGSQLEPDDPGAAEDAEIVGYFYAPTVGAQRFYSPGEVGHFAPMPDPVAHYRGMSWLTPVVREIMGDKMMTEHKLKFFSNGATPNVVIKFDASQTVQQVQAFKELFEEEAEGLQNAYRTLYLGGGADATVVGSDLKQLDFSATSGKAETRILMAAGVHPVIAGASEGMQGASLNAGNFSQVRRIFSDIHLQDLWLEAASALEGLLAVPPGAELTVDSRHIPFLQDDELDQANINFTAARAITLLVREGFTAESAAAAVAAGDMSLLDHTGLVSVQLQDPAAEEGTSNDNADAASGAAA